MIKKKEEKKDFGLKNYTFPSEKFLIKDFFLMLILKVKNMVSFSLQQDKNTITNYDVHVLTV